MTTRAILNRKLQHEPLPYTDFYTKNTGGLIGVEINTGLTAWSKEHVSIQLNPNKKVAGCLYPETVPAFLEDGETKDFVIDYDANLIAFAPHTCTILTTQSKLLLRQKRKTCSLCLLNSYSVCRIAGQDPNESSFFSPSSMKLLICSSCWKIIQQATKLYPMSLGICMGCGGLRIIWYYHSTLDPEEEAEFIPGMCMSGSAKSVLSSSSACPKKFAPEFKNRRQRPRPSWEKDMTKRWEVGDGKKANANETKEVSSSVPTTPSSHASSSPYSPPPRTPPYSNDGYSPSERDAEIEQKMDDFSVSRGIPIDDLYVDPLSPIGYVPDVSVSMEEVVNGLS